MRLQKIFMFHFSRWNFMCAWHPLLLETWKPHIISHANDLLQLYFFLPYFPATQRRKMCAPRTLYVDGVHWALSPEMKTTKKSGKKMTVDNNHMHANAKYKWCQRLNSYRFSDCESSRSGAHTHTYALTTNGRFMISTARHKTHK